MSKIAFVFPGQASQYVGMGQDLYNNFEIAKKMYDKANEVLGFDLKNISFNGPLEDLKQTEITQPAIFVHSVILNAILKEKGYIPEFTAGHSLGEYSALVCAGVLSFEDALSAVKLRGKEMQRAGTQNPGTMAAIVGMKSEDVQNCCSEANDTGVVIAANFNSPAQTVISGSVEGVQMAMKICKDNGAKIVKELVVSGAFHSPLMESAVEPLTKKLNEIKFNDAKINVIPNVSAEITSDKLQLKALLLAQVTSAVRWSETIELMVKNGVTEFVEIGPGKVLQGLIKRIAKGSIVKGIDTAEQLNKFLETE